MSAGHRGYAFKSVIGWQTVGREDPDLRAIARSCPLNVARRSMAIVAWCSFTAAALVVFPGCGPAKEVDDRRVAQQPRAISDQSRLFGSSTTTYDRIQHAVDGGRLSAKDGVILTARLLYSPASIPAESEYAPRTGETAHRDDCLTAFWKSLMMIRGDLSASERTMLEALTGKEIPE